MRILTINPGSTSTKLAVFDGTKPMLLRSISHKAEDFAGCNTIMDQYEIRRKLVIDELKGMNVTFQFDAVVGRGGLVKPMEGGVYEVNEQMINDCRNAVHQHACDLGCIIADSIAREIPGCRSFIADPGVTDELNDYIRVTGSPKMNRICIWHALNQRAIARRFANQVGRKYEDMNLIICHLGGGISVAAHDHGRAVDVNNSLDGDGPFSPERAGTLPAGDLVRMCFSGEYTEAEMIKQLSGNAGLNAHLGTTDMFEVHRRIAEGDTHAKLIVDAMVYHVSKAIAAQAAVLCGNIDAILITGGMGRDEYVVGEIRKRIDFLAPTYCFPGEDEMEAMALNAFSVLTGKMTPKVYK